MQLILKIGLVLGTFLAINVFYLLQTDTDELDGIPVLKDVVEFVRQVTDGFIRSADEKHESRASKQSNQETRSSVNKDGANDKTTHGYQEQKDDEALRDKRVVKESKHEEDTTNKNIKET